MSQAAKLAKEGRGWSPDNVLGAPLSPLPARITRISLRKNPLEPGSGHQVGRRPWWDECRSKRVVDKQMRLRRHRCLWSRIDRHSDHTWHRVNRYRPYVRRAGQATLLQSPRARSGSLNPPASVISFIEAKPRANFVPQPQQDRNPVDVGCYIRLILAFAKERDQWPRKASSTASR